MTPHQKDPDYLAFIRQHECIAPSEMAGGKPCGGVMEAHHLFRVGGRRCRDDRFTVPLCTYHHRELHDHAELKALTPAVTREHFLSTPHRLLVEYLDE